MTTNDSPKSCRGWRIYGGLVTTLCILLLATLGAISLGLATTESLFQSCQPHQPKSVEPLYCLRVIRYDQVLSQRTSIFVARMHDGEPSSYGFAINYPSNKLFDADSTHVKWKKDGVQITTYLDTKIFIPRKSYIGGR